jgi:hypothetical protein
MWDWVACLLQWQLIEVACPLVFREGTWLHDRLDSYQLYALGWKEALGKLLCTLGSYWDKKERVLCLRETKVEVIMLEETLG